LVDFIGDRAEKRWGAKKEGFSHYVIKNIGSEITILWPAIMYLKTNKLPNT
jgi:hypothetical protein